MYTDTTCSVELAGISTTIFLINLGIIQGSVLGPLLFNLFINPLIEMLKAANNNLPQAQLSDEADHDSKLEEPPQTTGELNPPTLAFADDFITIGQTESSNQVNLDTSHNFAAINRMKFGVAKCNSLVERDVPETNPKTGKTQISRDVGRKK